MRYRGVSHGSWCNSKTRPIKCKYCGKDVFYFSCDHESSVFFEKLGNPWPKHLCKEYLNIRNQSKNPEPTPQSTVPPKRPTIPVEPTPKPNTFHTERVIRPKSKLNPIKVEYVGPKSNSPKNETALVGPEPTSGKKKTSEGLVEIIIWIGAAITLSIYGC